MTVLPPSGILKLTDSSVTYSVGVSEKMIQDGGRDQYTFVPQGFSLKNCLLYRPHFLSSTFQRFDGTSPVMVHKPQKSSPTVLFTHFFIFVSDNVKLSKFFKKKREIKAIMFFV